MTSSDLTVPRYVLIWFFGLTVLVLLLGLAAVVFFDQNEDLIENGVQINRLEGALGEDFDFFIKTYGCNDDYSTCVEITDKDRVTGFRKHTRDVWLTFIDRDISDEIVYSSRDDFLIVPYIDFSINFSQPDQMLFLSETEGGTTEGEGRIVFIDLLTQELKRITRSDMLLDARSGEISPELNYEPILWQNGHLWLFVTTHLDYGQSRYLLSININNLEVGVVDILEVCQQSSIYRAESALNPELNWLAFSTYFFTLEPWSADQLSDKNTDLLACDLEGGELITVASKPAEIIESVGDEEFGSMSRFRPRWLSQDILIYDGLPDEGRQTVFFDPSGFSIINSNNEF